MLGIGNGGVSKAVLASLSGNTYLEPSPNASLARSWATAVKPLSKLTEGIRYERIVKSIQSPGGETGVFGIIIPATARLLDGRSAAGMV